jgi:hypothetical protein
MTEPHKATITYSIETGRFAVRCTCGRLDVTTPDRIIAEQASRFHASSVRARQTPTSPITEPITERIYPCRYCRAPCAWVRFRGKWLLLDRLPHRHGTLHVVGKEGRVLVVEQGPGPPGQRYNPHHATCPAITRARMRRGA